MGRRERLNFVLERLRLVAYHRLKRIWPNESCKRYKSFEYSKERIKKAIKRAAPKP